MPEPRTLETADEPSLRRLSDKGGPLACRWCATCDHHYRFCQCDKPVWKCRAHGVLHPMPGEPGGPTTLQDEINAGRI